MRIGFLMNLLRAVPSRPPRLVVGSFPSSLSVLDEDDRSSDSYFLKKRGFWLIVFLMSSFFIWNSSLVSASTGLQSFLKSLMNVLTHFFVCSCTDRHRLGFLGLLLRTLLLESA